MKVHVFITYHSVYQLMMTSTQIMNSSDHIGSTKLPQSVVFINTRFSIQSAPKGYVLISSFVVLIELKWMEWNGM